jgi:hypothetical protein
MHCVVHGANLVVFTLFDLSIITKIETLLVGVYAYFNLQNSVQPIVQNEILRIGN